MNRVYTKKCVHKYEYKYEYNCVHIYIRKKTSASGTGLGLGSLVQGEKAFETEADGPYMFIYLGCC